MGGETRISRLIGMIDCNPAGGSVSDVNFSQGTPWALCVPAESYSSYTVIAYASISGGTVNYTASKVKCRLLYGTF
ncbi:MAG: hypothetical protein GAK38_02889 [Xylophilus sp.]|nr:MAG: hypothetical protein GAK38_02889 [Xylophilus sp.]